MILSASSHLLLKAIYNLYIPYVYRAKTEKQAKKRHPYSRAPTMIPL
ncbi:hypothetical protein BSI_36150 [Bacillus inaquosorum KCTC 13429]|uniref:Uncharacterized protein n=1 Tax=Bacillus inaquosorum KCTC 13429 TaxID=1236548 RepID=A0A9W5LFG2_9BACI|nr:hypothetical protein BSI_36150 [Bacillus inaquosorum KCTC 13429]